MSRQKVTFYGGPRDGEVQWVEHVPPMTYEVSGQAWSDPATEKNPTPLVHRLIYLYTLHPEYRIEVGAWRYDYDGDVIEGGVQWGSKNSG